MIVDTEGPSAWWLNEPSFIRHIVDSPVRQLGGPMQNAPPRESRTTADTCLTPSLSGAWAATGKAKAST